MKIRTRLTLWFTLLVTALTMISGFVSWLGIRNQLMVSLINDANTKAKEVQNILYFLEREYNQKHLAFKIEDPSIFLYTLSGGDKSIFEGVFLQLTNSRGRVFASSPNLNRASLPLLPEGTITQVRLKLTSGKYLSVLYYCVPVYVSGRQVATLQIGLPMQKNQDFLEQFVFYKVLEVLFAIIFSIFLGLFLSKKALAPVASIISEVDKIDIKNFAQTIDTSKLQKDEIEKLAYTFNRLLNRLAKSVQLQNRFISDASHELRSPLTAIVGHAELLEKRGEQNPSILTKSSAVIIREAQRLINLVNDMLYLAKAESKTYELKELNLNDLIKEILYILQPLHPQISFIDDPKNIFTQGYDEDLKRVFINLINNALVAIKDKTNGRILIRLERQSSIINVYIEDNGVGLSEEHIEHIFERFYRVDSSRERTKGGSGLGLSIVYEIIKKHQGYITVESQVGIGSSFIIKLPLI